MKLTSQQTAIIEALARYKYLTNTQFALVIGAPYHSLRRATAKLATIPEKSPLLKAKKFPVHARAGRLEYVYRLGKYGQEVAAGLGMIDESYAVGASVYELDFFHRKAVITFRILLDQALTESKQYRVTRYENYFEKTGANNRKDGGPRLAAVTRVSFPDGTFFIPDSVFITVAIGKKWQALFALEYVRGNKKTRTLHQIKKHMTAMATGVVTKRYGIPTGQDYVALFLFEDEALRDRVLTALESQLKFNPFREHFLFASFTDARIHIRGCWRKVKNSEYLYDFIDGKQAFRVRSPTS